MVNRWSSVTENVVSDTTSSALVLKFNGSRNGIALFNRQVIMIHAHLYISFPAVHYALCSLCSAVSPCCVLVKFKDSSYLRIMLMNACLCKLEFY